MREVKLGNMVLLQSEFESLLQREFISIGVCKAYITLIDPWQRSIYSFKFNITDTQISEYFRYIRHDIYLREYIKKSMFENVAYLQKSVPKEATKDPIFQEIIKKSIDLDHSIGVISKLHDGYKIVFSAHTDKEIGPIIYQRYRNLWLFARNWLNHAYFQQHLLESIDALTVSKTNTVTPFTYSEGIVFNLLINGMSGSDIAKYRNVSRETVKSQIKQILLKTNCRSQVQLLAMYYKGQLIETIY